MICVSGFDCTEEENATALAVLRKRAWLALRAKVDEQTSDAVFLGKLRNFFEERFRYDENGTPRVWRPDDDIDGAFRKAKEQVRTLCLASDCGDVDSRRYAFRLWSLSRCTGRSSLWTRHSSTRCPRRRQIR